MKSLVNILSVMGLIGLSLSAYAGEQTQTFAVANMDCPVCPITVTKAIEKVDGVTAVSVNLDTKTATVTFDNELTTDILIAAASTNVGYPASVIETETQ